MFATQTVATVVGALTAVLVTDWVIVSIPGLCTKGQVSHFSCPNTNSFFSASVIWVYKTVTATRTNTDTVTGFDRTKTTLRPRWHLPCPHLGIPGWFTASIPDIHVYVQIPSILAKTCSYPCHPQWRNTVGSLCKSACYHLSTTLVLIVQGFSYIWPAVVVGFLFNHYIKRRYEDWWLRYAFVLTTSWNIAIAVAGIVIFFTLGYSGIELNWWGNTISDAGCDQAGCPYLSIPVSGKFEG